MTLSLYITHSDVSIGTERRFNDNESVERIKERLQLVVGTAPIFQVLQLRSNNGEVLRILEPNEAPLHSFGIQHLANVHVVDVDPLKTVAKLNDVSCVEKFRLADDEYDKRTNSFRKFKERHLVKPGDKQAEHLKQIMNAEREVKEAEIALALSLHDRVELDSNTSKRRRGQIAFIGHVEFKAGYWIGVKLDEPLGKNDGSVNETRYFEAKAKHGVFVRPSSVSVGDYPELDPFDEDGEDNNMEL